MERIELLEPIPRSTRSQVAVIFLDTEPNLPEEINEASLLAKSPTFNRLIKQGFREIEKGNTRPLEELLNALPD